MSNNKQKFMSNLQHIDYILILSEEKNKNISSPGIKTATKSLFITLFLTTIFSLIYLDMNDNSIKSSWVFIANTTKSSFISIPLSFLMSAIVFFVVFFANKNVTWDCRIDEELSKYDPVDKDAYRKLQEATKNAGVFIDSNLTEWVRIERDAITKAGMSEFKNNSAFLRKRLDLSV